eukprot:6491490-Amphidinium_carterae.2
MTWPHRAQPIFSSSGSALPLQLRPALRLGWTLKGHGEVLVLEAEVGVEVCLWCKGALAVLVVLLEVDVVEREVDELVALAVELEVVVVELEVDALVVLAVELEVVEVELEEGEELSVLRC